MSPLADLAHAWSTFMGGMIVLAKVSGVAVIVVIVGAFIYDMWTQKRDDE